MADIPPALIAGDDLCSTILTHWHCFEGNLGEVCERQGGVGVGLSEHNKFGTETETRLLFICPYGRMSFLFAWLRLLHQS